MENNKDEILSTEEQSNHKAKKLEPNKVKMIKIIGGIIGFVALLGFIIFVASPTKYVSCITFLGKDITVYYDDNGNLELPQEDEINRVGYEFKGWYTTKSFVEKFDPETFSGKKLYAKYERIVYTIEYLDNNYSFADESFATNGVQIWNPDTFFVKYNDKIVSDEAATSAWGQLVGTETDRVNIIYIANPINDGEIFGGWEVYLNTDTDLERVITTITPGDKDYCSLPKDLIIDQKDASGILLKPIWN